jgi:cobalt-zinc-cadmium efflux system outer membrane protein
MRRRLAIVMSVTLAIPAVAEAQTAQSDQHEAMAYRFVDPVNGLTLEQAIRQALDREPGLRAARADVGVARGMSAQAALRPNPTVTYEQFTEPAGTDAQTRVDVQWPLDLFRRTGRVNVADRDVEATEAATADRERLLIAEVRMKFGEVLAAVRELSISDDLVAVTSRQHTLMAARAEEGAIPPLERDMVRVELQRLEADRMLQAGHVEHALIELKRLLGLPADSPLTLREDLEELVVRETATDLQPGDTPTTARPDIAEARARVHAAEARIDLARRDGRFDVSLFGMYMRMDSGFAQRGFDPENNLERVRGVFHNIGGGVMVSVPLRDRKQGEVAAAEAQRSAAEAQLEARRLTAQAEIAAARARDEHAKRALALYTSETRDLARRNLDVVSKTYEVGRMTLFDVLNERRRYVDTERAYTNALREAFEARQALRTALGDVR